MSDNNKKSINELFDNYNGNYTCNEIDWGKNVGNEIIDKNSQTNQNAAIAAIHILQTELRESSAKLDLSEEDIDKLVKDVRRI